MWLYFNQTSFYQIKARDNQRMEKQERMFTLSKPKWSWAKIDSELKTKIDSKSARVSLKPTVTFEGDHFNSNEDPINQKVIIDTEKSLQYENQVGWNWHKSSNLPIISIKLQVKHQNSENLLPLPQNIEAKIFATKIIVNALERDQIAYLEDVGIRGSNKIELKDGCGFFSGIRFLSTSYNNEGVKFYLLIVIYNKTEGNKIDNIICSVLSPPVFVDSRKSARDYQEKRFLSFVQLFEPSLFTKQFTKRQNKTKSDIETKIINNMDGLFNYLTAPNIRHKVKHPLFLSAKFYHVFKILYNTNYFQNKDLTTLQLIKKLQRKLIRDIGGQKKNKKIITKNSHKPFIISLLGQCNPHRKSKILESLQYLDCKAVELVQYAYQIPQNYKQIGTVENIVKTYTDSFSEVQKISIKDISARKIREQQAIEMSARDQLNDSEEYENIKLQCKEEQNVHNEKINEREQQSDEDSQENDFTNHSPNFYRKRKLEEKRLSQLNRMRIDNQLNPVVTTQNALQPLRAENSNDRIGSAFNLAGLGPSPQQQINIMNHNLSNQINLNHHQHPERQMDNRFPQIQEQRIQQEISFNNINPEKQQNMQQQIHENNLLQQCQLNLAPPISVIPTVPMGIQSLNMAKNVFLNSMSQPPSEINPKQIGLQKQHLKNEVLSQIDMHNNFLQQMVIDNQMMKSKIQMIFEYSLIEQHHQQQKYQMLNGISKVPGNRNPQNKNISDRIRDEERQKKQRRQKQPQVKQESERQRKNF